MTYTESTFVGSKKPSSKYWGGKRQISPKSDGIRHVQDGLTIEKR